MLGKRLRALREDRRQTQKELADYLGLTPKMISFYELGQRTPPADILLKLADCYDVSVDYLLGNDEERPTPSYYDDPEVAAIANEMKENPDIRVLFHASKGLSKKSIEEVRRFVEYQKAKERGEYEDGC